MEKSDDLIMRDSTPSEVMKPEEQPEKFDDLIMREVTTSEVTKELDRYEDVIKRQSMSEMMEGPEEDNALQMIIAMKGDPYTGKTTCADSIAKYYRCSVVSFDDILDSLSPSSPPESQRLIDHAFHIGLRVAALQLELKRPVVVDSPLCDRNHLDALLRLVEAFQHCGDDSCDAMHCRLVIVECRPEAKYAWQMRFERRDPRDKYWFKPKDWWTDVKETPSLASYDLPSYVSILYVDTTDYVNHSYLGPATLDLGQCDEGHQIDLRAWLPCNPVHPGLNYRGEPDYKVDSEECGTDGRHFFRAGSVELQEVVASRGYCFACQEPISHHPGLVCLRCGELVLHKSCAELEDKRTIPDPSKTLPPFLRKHSLLSDQDSIPEEYRVHKCHSCDDFSVDCEGCLWTMHLRSGLVPTHLYHEGHSTDHPLCFWITSALNPREYQCAACKQPGSFVGYTCLEDDFMMFNLHVECAMFPRPVRNVHGGYEHDMRLVFGTNEIQEDYLCHVCGNQRDPTAWFYYCDHCHFISHLHCIYAPEDP